MKKVLLSLTFLLGFTAFIAAQGFEGVIEFKQYTPKDTTTNVYHVKGNNVKLDQLGKSSHKVEGSFVCDLGTKKIIMIDVSRKIFDSVTVSKAAPANKIDTVIKLKDTKTILGNKCTGYTVKSKADGTQITYWLAPGNYNFFQPFVLLWNRKDKQSVYFRSIKDSKGLMPLLSVETDLNGKEVGKLEVIKLEKKAVEASTFQVPSDFKRYK
ncbi:MAG TPA: DUF4412 domain-containing protein [Bacteroidia bacterium]|jgi:hypothetical protein|nr:DUF4412 domain-containing protein [Bacteroidia bacterium]